MFMRIYIKRDGKISKSVADKIKKLVQNAAKVHNIAEESIRVVLTEVPENSCYNVFSQLIPNPTIRQQVVQTVCEDITALTIYAGTPVIIINMAHPQIKRALEWENALEGLILHEVGHIRAKDKNIDHMIALAVHTTPAELIKELNKATENRANEIIQTVGLVLKDIAINVDIIKKGYVEEIYRHYDNVLEEKINKAEYTKEGKIDVLLSAIGLVAATAPFKIAKKEDYYDLICTDLRVHMPDTFSVLKKLEEQFTKIRIPPKTEEMKGLIKYIIKLAQEIESA